MHPPAMAQPERAPPPSSVPAFKAYADQYFVTKQAFDATVKALRAGAVEGIVRREERLIAQVQDIVDGLRARLDALEEQATRP